jgi:mannosyltransferase
MTMTSTSHDGGRLGAVHPPVRPGRFHLSDAVPWLAGAAGVLVSLAGAGTVSLWTDEAATVSAATRSLPELWALVQRIDAVHAAYYLLMHAWTSIAGTSPVALRLPSALAVGVAVVGVHRLLVVCGRRDAAVLGALVAIVLPRITWMGIEARSFGPSAAVATWATVLLVVALQRGGVGRWIGYALLVGTGTALNIYVALLVGAHAVTVVLARAVAPGRRAAWLVSAALGGLSASPVVLLAAGQQGQLGDNQLSLLQITRGVVVNQWFLGGTPTRVTETASPTEPWALAALGLAALCWGLVALGTVSARRRGSGLMCVPTSAMRVLMPVLVVPVVVVVGYSLVVSPLYNPRYFTFAAPACAALVGLGIAALRRRGVRTGVVAVVVLLSAPIWLSQRQVTAKSGTDWAAAAQVLEERGRPGDGVYFAPLDDDPEEVVERTTGNVAVVYPGAFEGLVDVAERTLPDVQDSLRGTSWRLDSSRVKLDGVDRLWVVASAGDPTGVRDAAVLEEAGLTEVSRWSGGMTVVEEWRRP